MSCTNHPLFVSNWNSSLCSFPSCSAPINFTSSRKGNVHNWNNLPKQLCNTREYLCYWGPRPCGKLHHEYSGTLLFTPPSGHQLIQPHRFAIKCNCLATICPTAATYCSTQKQSSQHFANRKRNCMENILTTPIFVATPPNYCVNFTKFGR
ncbi:hypothetical protein XELAEV_18002602mg [Xenopus laevis]|nr:hypothetical protein XELAEV_18002602mg [Xenopus laevis]